MQLVLWYYVLSTCSCCYLFILWFSFKGLRDSKLVEHSWFLCMKTLGLNECFLLYITRSILIIEYALDVCHRAVKTWHHPGTQQMFASKLSDKAKSIKIAYCGMLGSTSLPKTAECYSISSK